MFLKSLLLSLITSFLISCDLETDSNKTIQSSTSFLDSSDLKKFAVNFHEGKLIFENFCSGCHVAPEKKVTDQYMFDNLFERLPSPSENYFTKYIKDSKALKASDDKYAKQLSKEWNSNYEHSFNDSLTTKDFYNLIIYIKVAAKLKYK